MALQTFTSIQMAEGYRKRPTEDHGKLRMQYFEVAAVTVAGDDGSLADLCELPPGAVRVLPWLCRVSSSAFGASRTLDIGHLAYNKRGDYSEAQEAENLEAFLANLDNSSAVNLAAFSSTVMKYDLYSVAGVGIRARIQGGTWPIGGTIKGVITYVYE